MVQHFRRWRLPAKFHQRSDRVQSIEEEMRFYLHLQCLQMRSRELLLQESDRIASRCARIFDWITPVIPTGTRKAITPCPGG